MIPVRPASAREKVSRRRLPMAITKPANEEARVIALDKYAILDTDPDQFFDAGTLCVVDRAPRELAPEQKEALKALSRLVLAQLEFRRNLILLKEALSDRTKEEHERQRELVHVQETLMRVLGLRQIPKSASAR